MNAPSCETRDRWMAATRAERLALLLHTSLPTALAAASWTQLTQIERTELIGAHQRLMSEHAAANDPQGHLSLL